MPMIDARDQVGIPVITALPTYVEHGGIVYEVDASVGVFRESDFRVEFDAARTWRDSFPTRPFDRYSFDVRTPASTLFTTTGTA